MAQTKDGRKFNRIQEYTRQGPDGPVTVSEHIRSNPNTSTGKATGTSKATSTSTDGEKKAAE